MRDYFDGNVIGLIAQQVRDSKRHVAAELFERFALDPKTFYVRGFHNPNSRVFVASSFHNCNLHQGSLWLGRTVIARIEYDGTEQVAKKQSLPVIASVAKQSKAQGARSVEPLKLRFCLDAGPIRKVWRFTTLDGFA